MIQEHIEAVAVSLPSRQGVNPALVFQWGVASSLTSKSVLNNQAHAHNPQTSTHKQYSNISLVLLPSTLRKKTPKKT